jgi:acyl carrier protein
VIAVATPQEVFEFLKDLVLSITDTEEGQVEPSARVEDLGLESMDLVELLIAVRKKYGVEMSPRAFAEGRLTTLGQVADHIYAQMTLKRAG